MTDMTTLAGTLHKVVKSIAKFDPPDDMDTAQRQYSAFERYVANMCPLPADPVETMRLMCPMPATAADRVEHVAVPKRMLIACTATSRGRSSRTQPTARRQPRSYAGGTFSSQPSADCPRCRTHSTNRRCSSFFEIII